MGKGNLRYAWVLDKLANEHELGQSIGVSLEEF